MFYFVFTRTKLLRTASGIAIHLRYFLHSTAQRHDRGEKNTITTALALVVELPAGVFHPRAHVAQHCCKTFSKECREWHRTHFNASYTRFLGQQNNEIRALFLRLSFTFFANARFRPRTDCCQTRCQVGDGCRVYIGEGWDHNRFADNLASNRKPLYHHDWNRLNWF